MFSRGLCRFRDAVVTLVLAATMACWGNSDVSSRTDSEPLPRDAQRLDVTEPFGGTLVYPMPGEPQTLNPLMVADTRSLVLTRLTTATLLEWDPVERTIQDGLSAARAFSDDGRTLRIDLRQGVRFSDGTPLTAADVVFTIGKIYQPGSTNALRQSLSPDGKPLAVAKVGDHSVEVTFPTVSPDAEYRLTSLPILPRHRLDTGSGPIDDLWTVGTPPAEFAGLGPFVVESHQPGLRTVLRANPHYWKVSAGGRRLPLLDGLTLEYVEDRNAQLLRLQSGDLDIVDQRLRPEDLDFLAAAGPQIETADLGPSGNLTFLWFNLSRGATAPTPARDWFQNSAFRQAVSSAVNRQAIVDNIYGGRATPATALVPRSAPRWHVDQLETFDYDPDRALAQLTDGGFSLRDAGQRLHDARGRPVAFEMLVKADEVLGRTAAIVEQDLARLGIRVAVRSEEMRSIISRVMGSRDYEAVLTNLDFTFDPNDFHAVFRSSGPMHLWNPGQAEPDTDWQHRLDEAMEEMAAAADYNGRFAAFSRAQQIVAHQVPLIPLVNRNVLLAWRTRVRHLRPANQFPYTLWNSWELGLER